MIYELMQKLIAFKYSCKNNHWSTDGYASHLLFDRLAEEIDDMVDDIAERYFMARNDKKVFKKDILNPAMINKNLVLFINDIIATIEKIFKKEKLDEGMQSLLSDIESRMQGKLALALLK